MTRNWWENCAKTCHSPVHVLVASGCPLAGLSSVFHHLYLINLYYKWCFSGKFSKNWSPEVRRVRIFYRFIDRMLRNWPTMKFSNCCSNLRSGFCEWEEILNFKCICHLCRSEKCKLVPIPDASITVNVDVAVKSEKIESKYIWK